MGNGKISYAGIGAAVAGVIGILGIYSHWWESDFFTFNGTADISGQLALGMAIGLFAMGAAYVVISDPQIRRVTGALATLFAVVLTLSCVWGLLRTDDIAPTANVVDGPVRLRARRRARDRGRVLLVMRDSAQSEADEVAPMASDMSAPDGDRGRQHLSVEPSRRTSLVQRRGRRRRDHPSVGAVRRRDADVERLARAGRRRRSDRRHRQRHGTAAAARRPAHRRQARDRVRHALPLRPRRRPPRVRRPARPSRTTPTRRGHRSGCACAARTSPRAPRRCTRTTTCPMPEVAVRAVPSAGLRHRRVGHARGRADDAARGGRPDRPRDPDVHRAAHARAHARARRACSTSATARCSPVTRVYVDAAMDWDDDAVMEASLRRLADLEPRIVHAGHERSFDGAELRATVDAWVARLGA